MTKEKKKNKPHLKNYPTSDRLAEISIKGLQEGNGAGEGAPANKSSKKKKSGNGMALTEV